MEGLAVHQLTDPSSHCAFPQFKCRHCKVHIRSLIGIILFPLLQNGLGLVHITQCWIYFNLRDSPSFDLQYFSEWFVILDMFGYCLEMSYRALLSQLCICCSSLVLHLLEYVEFTVYVGRDEPMYRAREERIFIVQLLARYM